ncbi:MAG: fibronectin type III domain-containing protein [Prevotellaceae bacterium]|nr:fibronectin type III domain-containing protein [Prevotellaceae bacterium]
MKKYILLCSLILAWVSCEKDTEPFNFAPQLVTGEVTDLYRKGATVDGSIRCVDNCKIVECGVMYSTFEGMSDARTQTVDNATEGNFTVALTELTPGTTYYYCTYASSGYSTAKGEIKEFRTPSNTGPVFGQTQVANLTATSVGVSVTLEDNGGADLISSGYVYKLVDSEDDNAFKFGEDGTMFEPCAGTDFRVVLKDLVPGKTYGIRPYGKSSEDGYGDAVFVTMNPTSLPALSSCVLSDTTGTTITVSARILSEGASAVTERGFCYSTENATPTVHNLIAAVEGVTADMTAVLTSLRSRARYYIRAYAKNDEGYSYGEVTEYVVPEHTVLEVEASQVTDVTSSSAKLYGHVMANNVTVKSCGFCWSTEHTTPDVGKDSKYEMSTKVESFATVLTGLSFGKTYYFRAFAVNEKDEVYYGAVMSFVTTDIQLPSVATSSATDITETSARVSGSITSDGNGTVSSKGFCWSTTNAAPTVGDSKHEVSGDGTSFATVLTGLVPGQRYYVRFYAVNEKGTAYGETVEFTTVKTDAPVLAATSVSNVTASSATVTSAVTSDGGAEITEQGFCYATTSVPTTADHVIKTTGGNMTVTITGLAEETRFYVRSYAVNKNGTSYGDVASFVTDKTIVLPSLSEVTTGGVTPNSFAVSASVVSDGNGTVSERGFCFVKGDATPTVNDNKVVSSGNGASLSATVEGLEAATAYTVCAYARNEKGVAYSAPVTVVTKKADPSEGDIVYPGKQ